MIHLRAKRLLPSLLDGILETDTELDLRVHVASCARCRREQAELELSEVLLRRVPTALLPADYDPTSYGRLVSLSRWYDDPALTTRPDRWRAPALTAASIVAIFMMAVTVGTWSPIMGDGSSALAMVSAEADIQSLPMSYASLRH